MRRSENSAVKAGDPAPIAVTKLFNEFGGPLYSLAARICRGPEDAEDLLQEVFLIAMRRWHQFQGRSHPRTWLCTIAVRVCRRRHRRKSGEPIRMESLNELLPFAERRIASLENGDGDELSVNAHRESIEALQEAVASLPFPYRMPVVLKEILGLSVRDVAAVLGIRAETVKARLHRARLRLRKAILSGLPTRRAGPPVYSLRVCLDLLEAKQEALDRDVPFPSDDRVICDRCRSFFATMNLTRDLCRELADGKVPWFIRSGFRKRLREAREVARR